MFARSKAEIHIQCWKNEKFQTSEFCCMYLATCCESLVVTDSPLSSIYVVRSRTMCVVCFTAVIMSKLGSHAGRRHIVVSPFQTHLSALGSTLCKWSNDLITSSRKFNSQFFPRPRIHAASMMRNHVYLAQVTITDHPLSSPCVGEYSIE